MENAGEAEFPRVFGDAAWFKSISAGASGVNTVTDVTHPERVTVLATIP
jgi:hypothetical protein